MVNNFDINNKLQSKYCILEALNVTLSNSYVETYYIWIVWIMIFILLEMTFVRNPYLNNFHHHLRPSTGVHQPNHLNKDTKQYSDLKTVE